MELTRRSFTAALAAAPVLSAQDNAPRRGTMDEIAPFQETLVYTHREVAARVQPFPMTQVRLLPGIYKDAEDWNRGYMQRLAADRLVRNFLVNAGLPSSAAPLGGWEQDTPSRAGELRGHFTGHYLSAAALLYASTGDQDDQGEGRCDGRRSGEDASRSWAADI